MARGGSPNSSSQLAITPQRWLFSLKSPHAERVVSGDKHFEFRKVRISAKVGDEVIVYHSYPVKRVVASFVVGPASRFGISAKEAIKLEKPGKERTALAQWLGDAPVVTALEITQLQTMDKSLQEVAGLDRGPMSYQRMPT